SKPSQDKTMGFYVPALSHHSPMPLFQIVLRHATTAYRLSVFAQIDRLTLSSSYPYFFDFGLFVAVFFVLFSCFLIFWALLSAILSQPSLFAICLNDVIDYKISEVNWF